MANFEVKNYLTYEGLAQYDELLKRLLKKNEQSQNAAVDAEIARATGAEAALQALLADLDARFGTKSAELNTAIEENKSAIEVLNGDGDGSVAKQVKDAIDALVDGAPGALDTLKEIADWIKDDEDGTLGILSRIDRAEDDITDLQHDLAETTEEFKDANNDLKAYVDAQDLQVYNSTQRINTVSISALFLNKKEVKENETVADAIAALKEDDMLVLPENSTVAETLVIDKDVVIDGKGSTFTGNVTINSGVNAVIENATFTNPVNVK